MVQLRLRVFKYFELQNSSAWLEGRRPSARWSGLRSGEKGSRDFQGGVSKARGGLVFLLNRKRTSKQH